jgi:hypothetical protein
MRGCQDILIAVTDGLKGMPEALSAVFPATTLQTCVVHLIGHSLEYASWRDRRPDGRGLLAPRVDPRHPVLCVSPEVRRVIYTTDAS